MSNSLSLNEARIYIEDATEEIMSEDEIRQ